MAVALLSLGTQTGGPSSQESCSHPCLCRSSRGKKPPCVHGLAAHPPGTRPPGREDAWPNVSLLNPPPIAHCPPNWDGFAPSSIAGGVPAASQTPHMGAPLKPARLHPLSHRTHFGPFPPLPSKHPAPAGDCSRG